MRYLLLVTVDPDCFRDLPDEEHARLTPDSLAYDDALKARGVLVAASALALPQTATLVKVRNGRASFTEGPFTEMEEHIGGFLLVDVASREEALAIAEGLPMARYGTIEVRALRDMR